MGFVDVLFTIHRFQQLPSVLDPSETYSMSSTLLVKMLGDTHSMTFHMDAIRKIDEPHRSQKSY